ncbi:MAG: hypothetical protein ACRDSJ_21595, partial [Rubrobacteraceae bacterium]
DAPDTKGERVGFVGVSVGGSLALLAARDDSLEDRVSVVSCLAPYTDLENVLRLATTGTYPGEGEYYGGGTPHYLRVITVRSAVSLLPEGEERDSLLRLVPELRHYYGAGPDTADPLVAIPAFKVVNDDELSPETESLIKLLLNRDPERFDELYADLSPRMREEIEALSPASGANRIEAPVEIASAPRDEYFPVAESKMLEGDVPDLRLTVTPALKHVEPDPEDIPALLALNGFVVRSFEEASSEK